MEGLDIDEELDCLTLPRARQIILEQKERIHYFEQIEDNFKLLQRDYDRLKSEYTFSVHSQDNRGFDAINQELRVAKEAAREKERRLQYLEEANNRLVFRMRNLQVEISGKESEIQEINQELAFMKRKLDKPIEILINEIKQKDIIIESYKREKRQFRTPSIRIDEVEGDRMSLSSIGSFANSFMGVQAHQTSYYGGKKRFIRQNRVSVQDETEIVNEWNKTLQIFSGVSDPSFVLRMKQYVLLSVSRLAMLANSMENSDDGIFSQACYLCTRQFNCLNTCYVCAFCGYMFCGQCAPRRLPLGSNNELKRVCVICESMYKFVYKKDERSSI